MKLSHLKNIIRESTKQLITEQQTTSPTISSIQTASGLKLTVTCPNGYDFETAQPDPTMSGVSPSAYHILSNHYGFGHPQVSHIIDRCVPITSGVSGGIARDMDRKPMAPRAPKKPMGPSIG